VPSEGFFATARIAGSARARPDWPNRYRVPIDDVKLLASPISIEAIRAKLPQLSWAIYPRSIHTVRPEVAHKIRGMLAGNIASSGAEEIAIEQDRSLTQSQRETLILARRGQGQYRKQLIEMWNCCSITGGGPTEILRASHIKPWYACSSNEERLDRYNGLLLLPNLDALFDRALITFDEEGRIVVSHRVPKKHWERLGISSKMKVRLLPQHATYFIHHRMRFDELKSQA
jgi:HNH endonuclease